MNRRDALKSLGVAGIAAAVIPTKLIAEPMPPEGGCETTSDIEGPFYIAGAAQTTMLAPSNAPGTILFMTGTVFASDCVTPIPNALVDVWAANDAGAYENVDYRGQMNTDAAGQYSYQTILPGKYLNGTYYRPRHLHYKVSAPDVGSQILTTQIYFTGDTSIPDDPWASDPSAFERTIPLTTDGNGAEHGVADITIDVDPLLLSADELSAGITALNAVNPNPMGADGGRLHFQLATAAQVSFQVFNITGKLVKQMDLGGKTTGKHQQKLDTQNNLGLAMPSGVYIVRMLADGKAIGAKRFLLQR